ncbi:MAG: hypothetical protein ACLPXB_11930 [Thiobacillaceae bacterium]
MDNFPDEVTSKQGFADFKAIVADPKVLLKASPTKVARTMPRLSTASPSELLKDPRFLDFRSYTTNCFGKLNAANA